MSEHRIRRHSVTVLVYGRQGVAGVCAGVATLVYLVIVWKVKKALGVESTTCES